MIDRFGGLFADIDSLVSLGADLAVKATLICVVALLVDRLLARRVLARSAVWHACLLGLVLLVPAAVFAPHWRVTWLPSNDGNTISPAGQSDVHSFAERKTTMGALRTAKASSFAGSSTTEVTRPTDWPRLSIAAAVFVYLLGVCLLIFRLAASWLRATALVRSSATVDDSAWNGVLDECRRRLGLTRRIDLRSSSAVGVPLFVGWWRPTVLLPESVASKANRQTMQAVLLHELAHARRGDYAWNLLLRVTQATYWPHPLVWLMGKAISRVREEACDRVCLFWLGDAAAYRETLVELATGLVRRPVASLGMAITRTTRLERRLSRLDADRALPTCLLGWRVRAGLACAIVSAASALAALHLDRPSAAVAAEQKAQQPSAKQPANERLELTVNASRVLTLDRGIPRAQVNNPDILELKALSSTQVQIVAKKPGATQLNLWDKNEELHSFEVAVLPDEAAGQSQPAAPGDEPVKVRVAKVKREDFIVKSTQPCSLVASRTVSLHARVSGIITRRNVELGDRVKKGDVLAEIDAPEVAEDVLIAQADADEADAARMQADASVGVAQATIEEAQAALAQRQAEIAASAVQVAKRKNALVYTQKLREKNVVSEYETNDKEEDLKAAEAEEHSVKSSMAAAEANLSRAKAQFGAAKAAARVAQLHAAAARRHLERIRQHTEYLQIRAPIDGAVTEISANVGLLTAGGGKGEPLFVLSAIDIVTAVVKLPDLDALKVKRGDSVTVRFDALPKRTITAMVSRMAYAFDPKTRTLRTEIDLDNREGLLRPGMSGIAAIHLETHPNALSVPRSTPWAKDASGNFFVYRVIDGRAIETPVEVFSDAGDAMEVTGLAEGDVVISHLVSRLHNGAAVEIEKDDADAAP